MTGDARIPPLDTNLPVETKTATFAMGCFWGPDARFGSIDGVVRTRVGYAGGATPNPTYRSIGDHTEVIRIDYDPSKISYEKLLDMFWTGHDPSVPSISRQYRSLIFYHDEEQKTLATESRRRVEDKLGARVLTEIIPASDFYLAEPYHQKYYLRYVPRILRDLRKAYADNETLASSTAAARINGHLGGHGTLARLDAEIWSYALSPDAERQLRDIAYRLHE